ncbi:MAG: hypothetical protein IPG70_02980 [Moraxellaceae bacterium]|nr:hypothetical protein [Moraxellaceae bacterium]
MVRHDVMNALNTMNWDEETQAHHHQISQLLMRYQLSDLAQGQLEIAAADADQHERNRFTSVISATDQPSDNAWLHKAGMTLKRVRLPVLLNYRQWQTAKI